MSATSDNLSNLLSIAARFGQTIIVTDCDSGSIPSEVVPYLRYGSEGYRQSESATLQPDVENGVNFGLLAPNTVINVPSTSTKSTEVNAKFRVIMISSVQI